MNRQDQAWAVQGRDPQPSSPICRKPFSRRLVNRTHNLGASFVVGGEDHVVKRPRGGREPRSYGQICSPMRAPIASALSWCTPHAHVLRRTRWTNGARRSASILHNRIIGNVRSKSRWLTFPSSSAKVRISPDEGKRIHISTLYSVLLEVGLRYPRSRFAHFPAVADANSMPSGSQERKSRRPLEASQVADRSNRDHLVAVALIDLDVLAGGARPSASPQVRLPSCSSPSIENG